MSEIDDYLDSILFFIYKSFILIAIFHLFLQIADYQIQFLIDTTIRAIYSTVIPVTVGLFVFAIHFTCLSIIDEYFYSDLLYHPHLVITLFYFYFLYIIFYYLTDSYSSQFVIFLFIHLLLFR